MNQIWTPELITSVEEISEIYSFLNRPEFALNYPGFFAWLKQAHEELLAGTKKSFAIRDLERKVVATSIFQQDKRDKRRIEIKNRRVAEGFDRLGLGLSLLDAMESYARREGYSALIVDTHETNVASLGSLRKAGFREESRETLYTPEIKEVILIKKL